MGGFVGSVANGVAYFDQNLDSDVTLSSVGATPIYQARLDNLVTVQGLILGSFNAFGGPGVFGDISQLLWGTPIPSAPGSWLQHQHEHPHDVLADADSIACRFRSTS